MTLLLSLSALGCSPLGADLDALPCRCTGGTPVSWNAFQPRQFCFEQLLATAGPALLLSVKKHVAYVSALGYHKGFVRIDLPVQCQVGVAWRF